MLVFSTEIIFLLHGKGFFFQNKQDYCLVLCQTGVLTFTVTVNNLKDILISRLSFASRQVKFWWFLASMSILVHVRYCALFMSMNILQSDTENINAKTVLSDMVSG